MTNHPQVSEILKTPVDDSGSSYTPCGRVNRPPTWGFAESSTIHNPYYYCSSEISMKKK